MNKKIVVVCACLLALIGSISFATIVSKDKQPQVVENNITTVSKKVEDECTNEYIQMQQEEEIQKVNSAQEKITAGTEMILKKYYKGCDHTINEHVELPTELVNMTESELKEQYKDWEVIGFNSDTITLYKEFDGECGEHFKLKIEDDKIVVYQTNSDGTDTLYEKTDISSQYLPEVDLMNMEEGLEIFGKEELNKIIEDFE